MKTKDYVTILIRLSALFLLVFSIQNSISLLLFMLDSDVFLIESVISALMPIGAFALLWYFSPKLAHIMTVDLSSHANIDINHSALLRILVIAFGFSLLVNSVINSSYWFFNNMVFKANPEFSGVVDTIHIQKTNLATELVQILVAIIILAKNSWISQALLKINAPEPADIEKNSTHSD